MDKKLKLEILKCNLQLLTTANDTYLEKLLEQAEGLIKKEGIEKEDTDEYEMLVIDYAGYLFRKRANTEMQMPRHLRYSLNIILFSQKAK